MLLIGELRTLRVDRRVRRRAVVGGRAAPSVSFMDICSNERERERERERDIYVYRERQRERVYFWGPGGEYTRAKCNTSIASNRIALSRYTA